MEILLIILSVIGSLKLVSLLLQTIILSVKNNISKVVDDKLEKHYHEIKKSYSCGIADWLYVIPTIKTNISGKFFDIEIDIFVFYIYVGYSIVDIDEET